MNSSTTNDDFISTFPQNWNSLKELKQPLDWEAFLKSDLLANHRYQVTVSSIIARTTASISIIASTLLIVHILRSHHGLSTTYHRLVFGLSFADIIFSSAITLGSTMVPKEMDYMVPGAQGNFGTCTAQGFLISTGMLMPAFYNCSICLYYLAIIKYNKSNTYISNHLEPWFHAIPMLAPIVVGVITTVNKAINPWGSVCFAARFNPPHCIGYEDGEVVEGFSIPCGRGNQFYLESVIYKIVLYASSFPVPVIIVTTMVSMYRTVLKVEQNVQQYGVGTLRLNAQQRQQAENNPQEEGRPRENAMDTETEPPMKRLVVSLKSCTSRLWNFLLCRCNKNSPTRRSNAMLNQKRAILHMAVGYSLAWALVTIPGWIRVPIVTFETIVINNLLSPLQGLFSFIVFMSPKVRASKKPSRTRRGQQQEELSFYKACVKAYMSRGERRRSRALGSNGLQSRSSILRRIKRSLRQAFSSNGDQRRYATSVMVPTNTTTNTQQQEMATTSSNNAQSSQMDENV